MKKFLAVLCLALLAVGVSGCIMIHGGTKCPEHRTECKSAVMQEIEAASKLVGIENQYEAFSAIAAKGAKMSDQERAFFFKKLESSNLTSEQKKDVLITLIEQR